MKNLFVDPDFRGCGISKVIMLALEQYILEQDILEQGVNLCRLETGINQPESIGLYHSMGYQDCVAYGNYLPAPLCIFMDKTLE